MSLSFRDGITVAETEYGAVLLDTRSGSYWQLNPSAILAARVLVAGGTETDAADRLTDEFDVDTDRATADVSALVGAMRSAGVVTA